MGPMCVPGDPTPWGTRWREGDPEPWGGFSEGVNEVAGECDELYVFVHSPATSRPTTSSGWGSYNYWPTRTVGARICYVEKRSETGSHDEEVVTLHIAPVAGEGG